MKAATEQRSDYRADIDGLRGIAVLAVVAFHAQLAGFSGGYVGVDVFFVISGYLISGIIFRGLDRGTFRFADFYRRRINRIIPALIVILIATLILGWLFLFRQELIALGRHVVGGAFFLSNFFLWQETGYFDSLNKPLLHLWSLAVEEQFYLVYPAIAVIAWKSKSNVRWLLIAIMEISFVLNIWAIRHSQGTAAFYFPLTRFWEILAGALLYDLEWRPPSLSGSVDRIIGRARQAAPFVGLLLLVISIATFDADTPWPGWRATAPVAGTIFMVWGGSVAWINRVILSHPLLVGVGLISYPLYLWHWPLLVFAKLIDESEPSMLVRMSAVVLAVILAFATYRIVEAPIRFGKWKRRAAVVLLPCLVVVGGFGFAAQHAVLTSRLDQAGIRQIEKGKKDWASPYGRYVRSGSAIVVNVIPGKREETVLVIGDSHAEQYWPRVFYLAQTRPADFPRVVFMTYGGCAPYPTVNRDEPVDWEGVPWQCDRFFRGGMDYAARPEVSTIVLSGYWEEFHLAGHRFLTDDQTRTTLAETGWRTDRVFDRLEKSLANLIASGKRVFIILPNPAGNQFDPASLLPPRLTGIQKPGSVTSVPRGVAVPQASVTIARLRKIAQRTGASVIDPAEFLCDSVACPVVTPTGAPMYMDKHHLAASYVRAHASFIDQVIFR